jgi:ABC-type multidrug transport system fused ATPase/permease subunit
MAFNMYIRLVVSMLLACVAVVLYAFNLPKSLPDVPKFELFMKMIALGFLLLSSTVFAIAMYYCHPILTIITGITIMLSLNWVITAFFFDPYSYGPNQSIFGWVVAFVIAVIPSYLNVKKYIQRIKQKKSDAKCKKDARDKYKILLTQVRDMKSEIVKGKEELQTIKEKYLGNGE